MKNIRMLEIQIVCAASVLGAAEGSDRPRGARLTFLDGGSALFPIDGDNAWHFRQWARDQGGQPIGRVDSELSEFDCKLLQKYSNVMYSAEAYHAWNKPVLVYGDISAEFTADLATAVGELLLSDLGGNIPHTTAI